MVTPENPLPVVLGPLVLGIDGGGTKTLAWLARLDAAGTPQVIGRGLAGSSNRIAVGSETALANLSTAAINAFNEAHLEPSPVAHAVLAIAGSGTTDVQQQLLGFIKMELHVDSARVVHDGLAVLRAGVPDGTGIAIIAGTGTVAYGINQAGESRVVGGWGYWFGDEGSAYWLGQSALRAISQADDGRGPGTALTATVLDHLKVSEPRKLLLALSHQGEVRHGIAALAPLVCTAAEQQDEVATQIVAQAAQHWGNHVRCLAEQLSLGKNLSLAVAGGVLCGSALARDMLQEKLAAERLTPAHIEYVEEPVRGCVELAASDWRARG